MLEGFQLLAFIYKQSGSSVDPDQMAAEKPVHMDPHFVNQAISVIKRVAVKIDS